MDNSVIVAALITILLFSCNSKTPKPVLDNTEVDNHIEPEQASLSPLPTHDPYFDGTQLITSPHGPKSITRQPFQDSKGNYWFATWDGIIGVDQKSMNAGKPIFTNYTNKEKLRRFRAFTILEDSKGNIWFGTIGAGVYVYDGNTFKNYTTNDGLVFDGVGCLMEDSKGKIWMGTQNGISIWDGKSFTNFTKEDGMPDTDVNSIVEDKDGLFWIGTRGAVCTYDGQAFKKVTRNTDQPFINVRRIIKDRDKNIWLGGNDGLWKYNGQQYINLRKNFNGYIYEDRKGNIWISAEANPPNQRNTWVLSRYDHDAIKNEMAVPTEIMRINGGYFDIMEDDLGNVWVGSTQGVFRYNGKTIDNFQE